MWKTIAYESNYEVSDQGMVRNKETKHVKSLRKSSKGYQRVTLYPSGKTYSVHKLVAQAFIENESDGTVINHKDGNKENNDVSNLEWCTPKYNTNHAISILKTFKVDRWNQEKNPGSRLDYGLVYSIKFGILNSICDFTLSEMLGVKEETIRRIKKNILWKNVCKID